ncbi:type II toxin-antitoxin system VapC family toxin [Bosea sp. F3-2]|uniref:type II toxin-antitoxin system VapC family toxin n=1 Tax=Bosea sp. F3-2 TaxID=2599640 RepID=UPI0011EBD498|nr:type II toxin-antitoxin system VapC family toxin [Bosea sp. F3-2]QEL21884.1 type II toxin-antitoxin system VapC family toxin [Bosea sp. F3-2]
MKITVDTNVLVRATVRDDADQARAAERCLREAETIAVTMPVLCEFVWVLRRLYDFPIRDIAAAIRALVAAGTVSTNRPAVEAGLAILEAGGDFADGIIAYEGAWSGSDVFVSFDRQAVKLLQEQGVAARQP